VDAAVTAAADVKGAGGSVMVAGPKVPIGVGNYPEYDAIMAKNGGKPLISKDYKEILNQLAGEYPNLFPETRNLKITTYINSLNKPELDALSKKVLKLKSLDQAVSAGMHECKSKILKPLRFFFSNVAINSPAKCAA
jgi:hypothetical protein